jgi:hypothetical protein
VRPEIVQAQAPTDLCGGCALSWTATTKGAGGAINVGYRMNIR